MKTAQRIFSVVAAVAMLSSWSAGEAQARAKKYELTSCKTSNHDCISEGKYETSGACETALKKYKKENPGRAAGCREVPF